MALLLGGLFVLGLFCGEQAHAAESTGTIGDAAATREVQSPFTGLGEAEQTPQAHRVVRPAADSVAEPAVKATLKTANEAVDTAAHEQTGERVGGQTGERVGGERVHESVVRPVGRVADRVIGALSAVSPSADSDWPELPGLPGFSGLPGVPSLPSATLPGGDGVQPPQSATGDRPGGEAAVEDGARKSPDAEYGSAYGPHAQVGVLADRLTDRHDGGAVRPVHVPARTPGGAPTGALVNQSLIDTTSPRHGDLHAASFAEGAPVRLVPGGTAATDDAGVRDRHRDINEFPG
ncbi:hypothetical protein ABT009_14420 [Streptomyces sp. NPDC002896]|uniref:hypothetical protein n=1 Tax=Streptomyces sp. NPDC002896 TaxID=3154438 RepID=UPI0033202D31